MKITPGKPIYYYYFMFNHNNCTRTVTDDVGTEEKAMWRRIIRKRIRESSSLGITMLLLQKYGTNDTIGDINVAINQHDSTSTDDRNFILNYLFEQLVQHHVNIMTDRKDTNDPIKATQNQRTSWNVIQNIFNKIDEMKEKQDENNTTAIVFPPVTTDHVAGKHAVNSPVIENVTLARNISTSPLTTTNRTMHVIHESNVEMDSAFVGDTDNGYHQEDDNETNEENTCDIPIQQKDISATSLNRIDPIIQKMISHRNKRKQATPMRSDQRSDKLLSQSIEQNLSDIPIQKKARGGTIRNAEQNSYIGLLVNNNAPKTTILTNPTTKPMATKRKRPISQINGTTHVSKVTGGGSLQNESISINKVHPETVVNRIPRIENQNSTKEVAKNGNRPANIPNHTIRRGSGTINDERPKEGTRYGTVSGQIQSTTARHTIIPSSTHDNRGGFISDKATNINASTTTNDHPNEGNFIGFMSEQEKSTETRIVVNGSLTEDNSSRRTNPSHNRNTSNEHSKEGSWKRSSTSQPNYYGPPEHDLSSIRQSFTRHDHSLSQQARKAQSTMESHQTTDSPRSRNPPNYYKPPLNHSMLDYYVPQKNRTDTTNRDTSTPMSESTDAVHASKLYLKPTQENDFAPVFWTCTLCGSGGIKAQNLNRHCVNANHRIKLANALRHERKHREKEPVVSKRIEKEQSKPTLNIEENATKVWADIGESDEQFRSQLHSQTITMTINADTKRLAGTCKSRRGQNKVTFLPSEIDLITAKLVVNRLIEWCPFWNIKSIIGIGLTQKIISVSPKSDLIKTAAQHYIPSNLKAKYKDLSVTKEFPKNGDTAIILQMLPLSYKSDNPKRSDCHQWPSGTYLQMNGSACTILQRKQQEHNHLEWKGLSKEFDATNHLIKMNERSCIQMCSVDDEQYYYVISYNQYFDPKKLYLDLTNDGGDGRITKLSYQESYEKALTFANPQMSVSIDSDNDERSNEENYGKFIFTLTCPISKSIIVTPVRGKQCKHFQCFDLQNYLETNMNPSGGRWRCASCELFVSIQNLELCGVTSHILKEFHNTATSDRDRIEFTSDGTYTLLKEKIPRGKKRHHAEDEIHPNVPIKNGDYSHHIDDNVVEIID